MEFGMKWQLNHERKVLNGLTRLLVLSSSVEKLHFWKKPQARLSSRLETPKPGRDPAPAQHSHPTECAARNATQTCQLSPLSLVLLFTDTRR